MPFGFGFGAKPKEEPKVESEREEQSGEENGKGSDRDRGSGEDDRGEALGTGRPSAMDFQDAMRESDSQWVEESSRSKHRQDEGSRRGSTRPSQPSLSRSASQDLAFRDQTHSPDSETMHQSAFQRPTIQKSKRTFEPVIFRKKKSYYDIHEDDDLSKTPNAIAIPPCCSKPGCFDRCNDHSPSPKQERRQSPKRLLDDSNLLEQARRRERLRAASSEETNLERAVARAREKEKRLSAERKSKGVYIEGIDQAIVNTRVHQQRQVKEQGYKPYNIHDYRALPQIQRHGGLGADLENEEYLMKKALKDKARALARQVARENAQNLANAPKIDTNARTTKEPSSRDRALEFARNVPKPNPVNRTKDPSPVPARIQQIVSPQVQSLLQRHDQQRELVEKMRVELGLS